MDQTRNWMWEISKNYSNRPIYINSVLTSPSASPFASWEEFAFAKDSAGDLWDCVWPPRSYSCSFCWREFRSAQALGGHMNVHRRDRARLKLEASSSSNEEENSSPNPNPNPNPSPKSVAAASYSLQTQENCSKNMLVSASSFPKQPPDVSIDLKLGEMDCKGKRSEACGVDKDSSYCYKKLKSTDDLMFGLSMKSARDDQLQLLRSDEVLKFRTCQVEELDLELRLGHPPKIKQDCSIILIE
ncbi:hypothetical protein KFK09_006573 [Dendrobium nobile]|uniref:C2H2-type domain-containing protein n=1 Tax=Dendrobium nobile TaxID=94219 RepID=A0A8T3BUD9_DENNO|nr:hypothetical protein KFK09_006573 [Dendrobium nobile]